MKVSKATAEAHRQALLEAAGALYRAKGFDGVGIVEIGKAAGLTHGAIYGQFASKEALQAEAVGELFGWTARQVEATPSLEGFLDLYLSRVHVEQPAAGCPLVALAGDTARAGTPTKTDFAAGLDALVGAYAALAAGRQGAPDRAAAIASIAAMVGAVALARAAGDTPIADEVLATVRRRLEAA